MKEAGAPCTPCRLLSPCPLPPLVCSPSVRCVFVSSGSCYRIGRWGDVKSALVAPCRIVDVSFRFVAVFSHVMGGGRGTERRGERPGCGSRGGWWWVIWNWWVRVDEWTVTWPDWVGWPKYIIWLMTYIYIYFYLIIMDSTWNGIIPYGFHVEFGCSMESTWNGRNYSTWNPHGHSIIPCGIWSFHHHSMWNPGGMEIPKWVGSQPKHIPYKVVDSTWIPHGMEHIPGGFHVE